MKSGQHTAFSLETPGGVRLARVYRDNAPQVRWRGWVGIPVDGVNGAGWASAAEAQHACERILQAEGV
jgi:hypothetical protein